LETLELIIQIKGVKKLAANPDREKTLVMAMGLVKYLKELGQSLIFELVA
jgi:hypothetical protein